MNSTDASARFMKNVSSAQNRLLFNLQYSPSNLLSLRSRVFNAGRFPSSCGMCPVDMRVIARCILLLELRCTSICRKYDERTEQPTYFYAYNSEDLLTYCTAGFLIFDREGRYLRSLKMHAFLLRLKPHHLHDKIELAVHNRP